MRRACTLESLDELELSARTKAHIEKIGISLDEVVRRGRITDYVITNGPGPLSNSDVKRITTKWRRELALALDKAGFTGFNPDPQMFAVGRLYRAIFDSPAVTCIDEITNEMYERTFF